MMRRKRLLVLLKGFLLFGLIMNLRGSPLFILVAPPQPMARIVPTQI